MTPARLFAVIVFAAVAIALNLGFWLWSDRRRHDRLTLAVEDQTADDDLMAIVDAVAECGHRAMGEHGGGYVCRLEPTHNWLHADGAVRWDDGEAIFVATWQPAQPGNTPGELVPGEGEIEPQPTLGQERLYDAEGLVQYGLSMVHRACRDARRDAATDHVCQPCGKVFAAVTA
jgi:hypothetical protein